jgi:stage II sporulation protein AA (anti-sigma F factor antagonist)
MGDLHRIDQLFSVRDRPSGRFATVVFHAKYLNYDVSDGLKAALQAAIQARIDGGQRSFVLDLSEVSIVDSCGVGLMIWMHRLVEDARGALYVCGVTHFLQKIFRMMQLDRFFHLLATEEEAARRLEQPVA